MRYVRWTEEMLREAKEEYERDMQAEREAVERQKMILKMAKGASATKKEGKKKKSSAFKDSDD